MTDMRKLLRILLAATILIVAATLAIQRTQPIRHGRPADKPTIVSLAPSVTEILFELGKGKAIIGVTDRCNYPPEARTIEQVGGFGDPNVECLLALAPDLVIAAGFERGEVAETLCRSGIRVLEVQTRNFEELFDAIRKIGEAADAPQAAERLVTRMRTDLDAVALRYRPASADHPPKVFVEIGDHPLMTAGAASFLDDLIARAGGFNVAHEIPQAYPRVNPEQVIAWDPDIILVAQMDRPQDVIARLAQRIGWSGISAVKHRRVIADLHPDLLLRPGPRLIDGVKTLAARLETMDSQGSREARHASHP